MIQSLSEKLKVFRDDLYPFLGGGNKGRKMVAIGRAVLEQRANALVTTGGIQSNHGRVVAVFAAQHKMECTLVLHGAKEAFTKESGNAKIMRMSGAKIVFAKCPDAIGPLMDKAMAEYKKEGLNPYYIYGGGHTLAGGKAYIDAVKELKAYTDKNKWSSDYIFLASGTGSTQGGLLAGLNKYGLSSHVVGLSVGRQKEQAEKVVTAFYEEVCAAYDIKPVNRPIQVVDDYLCGGYGKFNQAIKILSDHSVKKYGFTLDRCYTAKAFYGMQSFIQKNNLHHKHILFWHTGGIFNFLAQ